MAGTAAFSCVLAALALLCSEQAQAQAPAKGKSKDQPAPVASPHRNLTAGGPLRPGVYGRIEVRGPSPPPVIFKEPVVGSGVPAAEQREPLYLYVPPGQVRKWNRHCGRWSACDRPVLFVRMDASPSRWGRWRHLREGALAQQGAQRPE